MRVRQLGTGDIEPPVDSARTKDHFRSLQTEPAGRFDSVWIDEAYYTGPLVNGDT